VEVEGGDKEDAARVRRERKEKNKINNEFLHN